MQKILVPCDGSESSLRFVACVASIAEEKRAVTIELPHVLDPMTFHSAAAALSPDDLARLCPTEAQRVLEPARTCLQAAGIWPGVRCRVGAPALQIAEEVTEAACDAVIMGTRGMRPFASLVIGSVAGGVVSLASVSVTLIK